MSNYFSCLATRAGLLNQAHGAEHTPKSSLQQAHHISQQHLDVQSEYTTIKASGAVRPQTGFGADAKSKTHPSEPMNNRHSLISASKNEETTEAYPSAIRDDQSSETKSSYPLATDQLLPEQFSVEHKRTTVENDPGWDTLGTTLSMHESRQLDSGRQSLTPDHDFIAQVSHAEATETDNSGLVDGSPVLLHSDVLDTPVGKTRESGQIDSSRQHLTPDHDFIAQVSHAEATETDNSGLVDSSPVLLHGDVLDTSVDKIDIAPKSERSDIAIVTNNQAEQVTSDPLIRVLEATPVIKADPTATAQPRKQSGQSSQINIQSITLEVHQSELARTPQPDPVPAPRNHTPAPNHHAPSQTRLSRYYLKGW